MVIEREMEFLVSCAALVTTWLWKLGQGACLDIRQSLMLHELSMLVFKCYGYSFPEIV